MDMITQKIATELSVKSSQVDAAIALVDEGATIPFIARYRKEATGGLDDQQLRKFEELLHYLRELEQRREVIVNSIKEQGKLTPQLEKDISAAETKNRLEDLYLPYKPKRRTKAQIAKEAGLEPLAMTLLENPETVPETLALEFLNPEHNITEVSAALDGARQILMEYFSEDADIVGQLREYTWQHAQITSCVTDDKNQDAAKYRDYFEFSEAIKSIPSHRALALLRGRRENHLQVKIVLPESTVGDVSDGERMIAAHFSLPNLSRAADAWLAETIRWTWKFKIFTRLELEFITKIREQSEVDAIDVFANNLRDLLLAAPAGQRVTLGLDPGIRTGVKVVVIDNTGKVIDTDTIYPLQPKNQWDQSVAALTQLCLKHHVNLISIGNGTGSRETDRLVADVLKNKNIKAEKIIVSEAGASVYSASELASKEFPDLDVTLRGAVSIARRLQDPLAELVKIDPKSIGVGQYQHDVNQVKLARSLGNVVEDCVNAVGVDVNTASAPLLTRVSGLSPTLAKNIADYRDQHGAFSDREQLKLVPRLGQKAYEQAAGFLRIMNGSNPLDASAVHPESYPVVEKILAKNDKTIQAIIGRKDFLSDIKPQDYTDDTHGLPTVIDIIKEIEKPGRDPRPDFKTANFKDGVEELKDLREAMILEGVVSNVTNFGAFVDIGVHQDGLVHISQLSDTFVSDPRTVVKSGDIVTVKVLEVDIQRKRVSLTMNLAEKSTAPRVPKVERSAQKKPGQNRPTRKQERPANMPPASTLFGDKLKAMLGKKQVIVY